MGLFVPTRLRCGGLARGLLYCVLWCGVVGFAHLGCTSEEAFEENIVDDLYKDVNYKSFTLPLSTVYYPDSILTQTDSLLYIGHHDSPTFGSTRATSFATLQQQEILQILSATLNSYDSIVFELVVAYAYGERNAPFHLRIHPLKTRLNPETIHVAKTTTAYLTDTHALDTIIQFDADKTSVLRLHARKAWADDFFSKAAGTDGTNYLLDYAGLAFVGGPANKTIIGAHVASTRMYIYYKGAEAQTEEKVFLFTSLRYSQYETDISSSTLKDLQRGIHTVLPTGYAYAQAAAGIFCGIDLSPVQDFYEETGGFGIVTAALSIGPLVNQSDETHIRIPPAGLRISRPYENPTDARNNARRIVSRNIVNDNTYVSSRQDDYFYQQEKGTFLYTGHVATTLQQKLAGGSEQYWVLSAFDFNGFAPIVLLEQQLSLKLYYILP